LLILLFLMLFFILPPLSTLPTKQKKKTTDQFQIVTDSTLDKLYKRESEEHHNDTLSASPLFFKQLLIIVSSITPFQMFCQSRPPGSYPKLKKTRGIWMIEIRVQKEVIRRMKSMFYYRHCHHHTWELYIGVGSIEVSDDVNNVSDKCNAF
jgi:hypothetical protein